jgi:hypothetical protein
MRKKAIVSQTRQKLILTALDRKDAGLSPNSQKALAPVKSNSSVSRNNSLRKTTKSDSIREAGQKMNFARTSRIGRNLFAPPVIDAQSFENDQPAQLAIPSFALPKNKTFPLIGKVTDYLDRISVAIILLSAPLKENESVLIKGEDSIYVQQVDEMQIDRKPVAKAKKGSHIGLKVSRPAEVNGEVYRLN